MTAALHPKVPPLRIGILGCANIARQFVRDAMPCPDVRIVAAASRKAETAAAFAADLKIPRSLGSYEALLADDEVDAVYIPLPNSLHAEWAIKAADAGKHVLCEKPLSLGLAEAEHMFDAARRNEIILLEAYPYYFQPQTGAMLALLHEGAIGEVRGVQASFGFSLSKPAGNIRFDPALGGGALLDAGCYALSIIRLAMGEAPVEVRAEARWDPSGVDIGTTATLRYADGRRAQLSCAMDTAVHRRALIIGSAGAIETEYLNHTSDMPAGDARGYVPSEMRLRRGINTPFERVESGVGSGFRFAAEAFAKVVRECDFDAIGRAAEASLDNMVTLEAIARSSRSGLAEPVKR